MGDERKKKTKTEKKRMKTELMNGRERIEKVRTSILYSRKALRWSCS